MSSSPLKNKSAYGIIGENKSDAEMLENLVRKIAGNPSLSIKTKGYEGCAQLLRKGVNQLILFSNLGCDKLIVCHDADGFDPGPIRAKVEVEVVKPSGLGQVCCIIIAVREIEAWILADIQAVTHVIKSWKPKSIDGPESIPNPKGVLERLSEGANHKPRYEHVTHNPIVAKHLNLDRVHEKCPSFRPLVEFVTASAGQDRP